MKRITFSVMMALASMVANAQETLATWTAILNTTEKVSDLQRGAPMTIDNEGNAIVTGTYTKDVAFASSNLEPIATSAFVAKYDKAGDKKWAAGLKGAATVKAVANDAEGNIYVAGNFAAISLLLRTERYILPLHFRVTARSTTSHWKASTKAFGAFIYTMFPHSLSCHCLPTLRRLSLWHRWLLQTMRQSWAMVPRM